MGASVHITIRGGPELAEATVHTTKDEVRVDHTEDRTVSLLHGRREQLIAIHHDFVAWETQRRHCSGLDFAQEPSAPRRWAANEDLAIDLLRRLADYHGW